MGIRWLACCVWSRCRSLVPVPVSRLQEAARHSPRGVEAWAGRMGSGGRPRWKRRHAGAGPVAVARGRGHVLQAKLRGARAQWRRRARWGSLCGPRDVR